MPSRLTTEQRANIENELGKDRRLNAIKLVREYLDVPLGEAETIVESIAPREEPPLPSAEQIAAKASELRSRPVAFEALWDGDTAGWFLVFLAILDDGSEQDLACLRGPGGDMRLFNAQVPPWPESALAHEAGSLLATRYSVPFWFPSPDAPRDDAARWRDRDSASRCPQCGVPVVGQCRECDGVRP